MYGSATDYRTTHLLSFRDLAMNQGDQDRNNEIPPRCYDDSPAMGQRVYDTARVQRTSQVPFIRDQLDQGLSPATVAEVATVIAQMESRIQAAMLTISITSGFPGFQRSMTFQDGVWSGHDPTHHFTDDRAAISYSSANGGVHQTRSMQVPPRPPPPPPPISVPQPTARAGEPPGSQASPPAPTPPNMTNKPLTEQAVISALQAVAVDPHYTDFMRSLERCWPELRQIALPTVTIQNENAVATQPAMNVPHVNPLSEQPGHSRTVTIERSRSPHAPHLLKKGEESAALPLERETIALPQEQVRARCHH